ncbi:embryonic protein UVS.2-like [Rana temporaria]|uniref:embryonic protein UVS.2-like n=1 Tax=Rana temporaria TaxID=8407 RepID=UPI001AADCEFE|nr:embryonic protein UVS.2-like [Rana temporaria]
MNGNATHVVKIRLENVVEKEDRTMAERPRVEPPEVFSLIIASNKESKVLLHEGDIAVDFGRNAMKCDDNSCRWTKNSTGFVNVPYTLSSTYSSSNIAVFLGAMQEFATLTCVRFIPRSTESDYVQIMDAAGCWSFVGKQGGSQSLSVSSSCMVQGSIQHELNHALGFFHEQSRSDRDDYINIIYSNIIPGTENNFQKFDTLNQGIEYDYGSVMHYPRSAFSADGISATIVPKPNASIAIGQRYGLSNLDVAKINKLYNCGLCRTILSNPSGSLTSSNYPNNYPTASSCLWLIRVPSNQVFLQFLAFDVQNSAGCASDYLRIYDGPTTSSPVLLDRACGAGQLPPMVSTTNKMLLEFVSDNSTEATGFKASYSTVSCGSVLSNPTGTFSTPNYPSNYPNYMDCTWVVTAPIGYQVSVNVTDFSVEYRSTCTYDYMLVFDGPKTTSPLMGRYCGKSTLPIFTSTGNTLVFQFHSDDSVQLTGFFAKYAFGKYIGKVL